MNADYDPRPLIGEPLAVDLLNTMTVSGDLFDDPLATKAWLRAIERPHVDPTKDQVNALRQTRAVTEALFLDVSNSGVDRGKPLDLLAVNEILAKGTPVASPDLSITYLASPPWQLPISIIVDAFELARLRPERLRQCQHENCILWFCDISKGGRRCWCSMERCGNRKKAERNYRKKVENPQFGKF